MSSGRVIQILFNKPIVSFATVPRLAGQGYALYMPGSFYLLCAPWRAAAPCVICLARFFSL